MEKVKFKIICQKCGGDGKIINDSDENSDGDLIDAGWHIECGECDNHMWRNEYD